MMEEKKQTDLGKLGYEISNPNLILIGRIFTRFGYLENQIEMFIHVLSCFPDQETSDIVISTMNFNSKIAVLRELIAKKFKDKPRTLGRFGKVDAAIQTAQGQRNMVAHAKWFTLEKLPDRILFSHSKMKARLESEVGAMSTTDFERIIQHIDTAIRRLDRFIKPEDDPAPSETP